jgi:HEAT repeat protein
MRAARSLIELGDYSCTDTILQILEAPSDPQDTVAKESAIELVPKIIPHLGKLRPERLYEFLEIALEDPAVGVRMDASRMLGQLNVVGAIPSLQAALAKEQEPTIRDIMATELARLEKKRSGFVAAP